MPTEKKKQQNKQGTDKRNFEDNKFAELLSRGDYLTLRRLWRAYKAGEIELTYHRRKARQENEK